MKEAIQLLQYWQEYTERTVSPDMKGFASWLVENLEPSNGPEKGDFPPYLHTRNMSVSFLIGHLMAFAEIWTKLTFRDLPIQHFHDFGNLIFISESKNPTKKEVARQSFLEQSSCFEALKRMTKNGLLADQGDPKDKRARRVSLTKKGQEVLDRAMHQVSQLSDLLVGDLTEAEKKDLIVVMSKLITFHENLYQTGGKERAIAQYGL